MTMKKTVDGVEYDTEHAELIANHDADDNRTAAYLYRTKEGKYFLRTEKMQIRKGRAWHEVPMDGSAKGHKVRIAEEITGLTENQAIDWFVANLVPKCFAASIQEQLGHLVSFDLGELAEPLARYCKDKGVTSAQAVDHALRDHVQPQARGANEPKERSCICKPQSRNDSDATSTPTVAEARSTSATIKWASPIRARALWPSALARSRGS